MLVTPNISNRNLKPTRAWALCLGLLLLAQLSNAQVQQAWVATYNNGITNGTHQALKLALDTSGNIYVTGFSQNVNSNLGYATLKFAPDGTQLWANRYDSTNAPSAQPTGVAVDSDGNVVVSGTAAAVKYSSRGDQLWTAPYASVGVGMDRNGNAYLSGFPGFSFNTVKLNGTGTNLWSTNAGITIQLINVDPAGDCYVSGDSGFCYGGSCEFNPVTVAYNTSGNQIPLAGPRTTSYFGFAQTIACGLNNDGDVTVVVSIDGDGSFSLAYLQRYTPSGSNFWSASIPQTIAFGPALALDSSGNAYVTGQTQVAAQTQYCTAMFDTNGTSLWTNDYWSNAGTSAATAIATDQFGDAYVTGYSAGPMSSNDIVTIKYDHQGNQIWLERYDGPAHGDDEANAIALDANGNVYVAGYQTVPGGGTEMALIKYAPIALRPPIFNRNDERVP